MMFLSLGICAMPFQLPTEPRTHFVGSLVSHRSHPLSGLAESSKLKCLSEAGAPELHFCHRPFPMKKTKKEIAYLHLTPVPFLGSSLA